MAEKLDDFAKEKLTLILGLVGVLIALAPSYSSLSNIEARFLGSTVRLSYGYVAFAVLLGFSLYFYAVGFIGEMRFGKWQKAANMSYALALLSVPSFLATFAISAIGSDFGLKEDNERARLIFGPLIMVATIAGSFVVSRRMNRAQKRHLQTALEMKTQTQLARALDVLKAGFYEEAVMTAGRAVEAALVQRADKDGKDLLKPNPISAMRWGRENRLFPDSIRQLVARVGDARNRVAHSLNDVDETLARQTVNDAQQVVNFLGEANPA